MCEGSRSADVFDGLQCCYMRGGRTVYLAGDRAGGVTGIDSVEGRYGDEACTESDNDGRDGTVRTYLRGLYVGVKGVNAKLKARTVRIVSDLLGVSAEDAGTALDVANGDIKVAILMNKLTITREDAQDRLEKNGGHLREALKH